MLNRQFRCLLTLSVFVVAGFAQAQDSAVRGRKYTPPPNTAKVEVAVVKDANGKPIENAAVIFHMVGEEGKGNMELKTNEEGKAVIEVIPVGDTVTLQVIATGFQTFGKDYKIDTDSKDITVRLKRPQGQYSVYTHSDIQTSTTPVPAKTPPASSTQPAPQ